MRMLIEMLEAPKEKPDWKCACNLMKMAAASLTVREMFIEDAFDDTIHCLFRNVILCITDQQFGKELQPLLPNWKSTQESEASAIGT